MHYKRFDFPGCPLVFTNHVKHSAGCGAHEALPLRASHFDQRALGRDRNLGFDGPMERGAL
jgi:hypothetical protein